VQLVHGQRLGSEVGQPALITPGRRPGEKYPSQSPPPSPRKQGGWGFGTCGQTPKWAANSSSEYSTLLRIPNPSVQPKN
jgi:hypothetical protein